jgi:hypothetical protein
MIISGDPMTVEGDGFVMLRTDDDGWVIDDRGWITDDPDTWKVAP